MARVSDSSLYELIERLKSDSSDYRDENVHSHGLIGYLESLIRGGIFVELAAIGSAKQAISKGFLTLSDNQIRAIALEILQNEVYMEECPNEWCCEGISWEDMGIALDEG